MRKGLNELGAPAGVRWGDAAWEPAEKASRSFPVKICPKERGSELGSSSKTFLAFSGSPLGAEGEVGHVPLPGAAQARVNTALM